MKKNLLKRILCVFVVMALCSLSAVSAFAEDVQENVTTTDIVIDVTNEDLNVQRAANPQVWASIQPNSTAYLYPTLKSYIGLTQRFYVTASSHTGSNTGAVLLYLTSPNGNLVSNDWIIGTNEATYWDVFLPASGTWTLKAVAYGTDASLSLSARWGEP